MYVQFIMILGVSSVIIWVTLFWITILPSGLLLVLKGTAILMDNILHHWGCEICKVCWEPAIEVFLKTPRKFT